MAIDMTPTPPRTNIHVRHAQIIRQLFAIALIFVLGPAPLLFAQASAVGQSVAGMPMSLHITILEGEDALNNIRERTAREPIVQVEDENHKPVAGALILFSIDNGGGSAAGGTFSGLNTISVTTGADGRAVGHGLLPNKTPGKYAISVSATLGALVATAIIHQENILGAAGGSEATPPEAPTPQIPPTVQSPPVSNGPLARPSFTSRLAHIPKKYYIVGGSVIVIGTILGITLTGGKSPTTITAGTGTVGP